jgi:hypothetical protein
MNRKTAARLRAKHLADISKRVRKESMKINAEFAAIERDPDEAMRRRTERGAASRW